MAHGTIRNSQLPDLGLKTEERLDGGWLSSRTSWPCGKAQTLEQLRVLPRFRDIDVLLPIELVIVWLDRVDVAVQSNGQASAEVLDQHDVGFFPVRLIVEQPGVIGS